MPIPSSGPPRLMRPAQSEPSRRECLRRQDAREFALAHDRVAWPADQLQARPGANLRVIHYAVDAHDELVAECKTELSEEVATILSESMVRAGEFFCKTIPMVVEPEIGLIWDH